MCHPEHCGPSQKQAQLFLRRKSRKKTTSTAKHLDGYMPPILKKIGREGDGRKWERVRESAFISSGY